MKRLIYLILLLLAFSACKEKKTSKPKITKVTQQQKEVENAAQLKQALITAIVQRLQPKDTLFLVTSREMPMCGNDERFSDEYQKEDSLRRLKEIHANPYFVNQEDYQETYQIAGHTVVTGVGFENTLTAKSKTFEFKPEHKNKLVYDLTFMSVTKNEVEAVTYDYYQKDTTQINLKATLQNSQWAVH